MVHFPKRKCYQIAKISLTLVLVLTVLSWFEYWRGGKRGTVAYSSGSYLDPEEMEYERQILEDEARIVPGLGEGGVAVHFTDEREEKLGKESEKKLAMNVYLSDRISYNRTLTDHRHPACQRVIYDAELPSASVIIIFHNEPYSVVLRTIWSVINSAKRDNPWFRQANYLDRVTGKAMNLGYPNQDPLSPLIYLKEIILVDDNSTLPELKGKLSHYIRTRMPSGLIRILRLPDRVGLTRARLAGARYASGDVVVFLDAHCEAQPDWLRPMLQRIKDDPHAVVMPIIDVIEASDFYYSVSDPASFQVGGFNFMGHFTWIDVNEKEKKRRGSDIAPTWSPTMAGGLFAINRDYYWELGAYDEQMAGWGGENLEMSFRIWQCGGTLETVPCSRVGHVFRAFHPYGMPANTDTHGINTARMAEVWMDDYKELYYIHRPDLRNSPKIGDVTHRKILREKLHCKSFQWYLDNIYPEKFVPVRDAYGFGRFRNPHSNLCLDSLQRETDAAPLGVYPCHTSLQATQYFALAKGTLRDEERCSVAQRVRDPLSLEEGGPELKLLMMTCRPSQQGQKWRYLPSKQLQHEASGYCLDAGWESGADVKVKPCQPLAPSQIWTIDYTEDNQFKLNDGPPSDLELTLQKLRGLRPLRRIGRSLMAATEQPVPRAKKHRRKHRRAKKHTRNGRSKNRFILKLVRSRPNGTAEHLEVDVHCRHERLLPNNTFVRDLVALLTDHDIKVINNGRVFERNKVTDLNNDAGRSGSTMPTTTQSPPPQASVVSVQPRLWPKKKRPPPPAHAALAPAAPPPPSDTHKIIIEDFMQLKEKGNAPQPLTQMGSKLKRKQRHRVMQPRDQAPVHAARNRVEVPEEEEEQLNIQSSVEESPMLADRVKEPAAADTEGVVPSDTIVGGEPAEVPQAVGSEPVVGPKTSAETKRDGDQLDSDMQNSDNDEWFMGVPHFRTDGSKAKTKPVDIDNNEIDEQPHTLVSATPPPDQYQVVEPVPRSKRRRTKQQPLKVVMKSNLTFNLGDELFKWRAQDDVADLLGSLTAGASSPATPSPLRMTIAPDKDRGDHDSDSNSSGSDESQE